MDGLLDTVVEEVFNLPTIILLVLLSVLFVIYKRQNDVPPSITKPQPKTKVDSTIVNRPASPPPKQEEEKDDGTFRVKIFFGSQTGTAEDFANTLSGEAKRNGFNPKVIDLEKYNPEHLAKEKFVIFVLSTYGDGEPTDNAKAFYDWLMSDERQDGMFDGLQYSIFGLGNKTYEHFNAMSRRCDERLSALGARRLYARGEGDDDSSLEDDFATWKKDLWPTLQDHFGIEGDSSSSDVVERRTKMITVARDAVKPRSTLQRTNSTGSYDHKNPYDGTVVVNRELHGPTSERSCRHLDIAIEPLSYEPGDHLGVFPENDETLVSQLAARLGVTDLNQFICLLPINAPDSGLSEAVLGPCSVQAALGKHTDITTPPRKAVLRALADYTSDPQHKARLLKLADTTVEGVADYNKYIKSDTRTILEVLNDFPSINIPLDHFLEIMPRLAPRYYSISSSPLEKPGMVSITAVVTTFTTPTGRVHNGVCTTWLAKLPPKTKIEVFVRRSSFRLPLDNSRPLVMVGPGTGLAPFRGFIQHRKLLAKSPEELGEAVLFFGCREREKDYIYGSELEELATDKWLSNLFVAFSRAQEKKVYVQHHIEENSALVWKLLHEGKAHFYICGDASAMEKDVNKALKELIQRHGSKTEAEAEAYIAVMKRNSRLQTDTWF